jgi:transposase-like protein
MDLERYRAGVEYLVFLALCGRAEALKVLELYSKGLSATQIAKLLDANIYTVKTWIQKLYLRVHPAYAPLLIRRTLPHLREIKPITNGYTCLMCGITFRRLGSVAIHVMSKHRDLIHIYAKQILAKLGGVDEPEGEKSWGTSTSSRNR